MPTLYSLVHVFSAKSNVFLNYFTRFFTSAYSQNLFLFSVSYLFKDVFLTAQLLSDHSDTFPTAKCFSVMFMFF
jgi:hypothetical protein